jgi:hypothetical protein
MIRKIFNFVLNGGRGQQVVHDDETSWKKYVHTYTKKGLSHDHIRPGIANRRRKKKGQHVIGSKTFRRCV